MRRRPGPGLPTADRTSHLLLALRADEAGLATVANLAFSGTTWRVRRRLDPRQRPALAAAVVARVSPASDRRSDGRRVTFDTRSLPSGAAERQDRSMLPLDLAPSGSCWSPSAATSRLAVTPRAPRVSVATGWPACSSTPARRRRGRRGSRSCGAATTEPSRATAPRPTIQGMEQSGPSFGARILAVLVLAVAAWFLLKVVISAVVGIAWIVAVVVAIIGVLWAVRTLT